METIISSTDASPRKRAERLRLLRNATLLSRIAFSKKYHIPKGTLQNWEDGRYGGLTEKGAKIVLNALQAEGIRCSVEWLLYNIGNPPVIPSLAPQPSASNFNVAPITDEEAAITRELQFFHQIHYFVIDMLVQDNAMAPKYLPGDLVAGQRIENFTLAISLDCIVQTTAGEILLRNLQQDTKTGNYKLRTLNVDFPERSEAKLISVAPVLWVRVRG